jgi:hypothetical protein
MSTRYGMCSAANTLNKQLWVVPQVGGRGGLQFLIFGNQPLHDILKGLSPGSIFGKT